MGKGGTRFVSDAIAVRAGRRRSTFSARELRRDMEAFCETGVHPDIEKAVQQHHDQPAEKPLPEFRHNRPFVYFQLSIAKQPVGRITVELFEEQNPRGVDILRSHCTPGSRVSVANTCVHKLLTDCAFFMGKPRRTQEVVSRPHLNHTDRGAVSVSLDGNEVAVSLKEDALSLDETHQVVGRVYVGLDILDKINNIIPGPTDAPLDEVKITGCGLTDHRGAADLDATSNNQKSTDSDPERTVQKLQEVSQRTRTEIKSALEEGISRKRKQSEESETQRTKRPILGHDLSTSSSSSDDD